ncbi:MAG: hypothetical protein A3I39_01480 [Candidatus Yanofskybacteria bacterium RIFCSPLOWO2_02_FULL_47_9b]|uniref:Uncharacterized protein n=1 Tax=Candidatus Yanofskybacteria bacterium RIFCSPLOWO2_02_FULL_47_9b TaxID=1802708 RepID=A0A1F8H8P9_9BACT|nr:MAG: hypothetical protein A3I39_01480 [Candidatus Yanofskybacteria bacterium RIFCSPLOWO2_02_FULL_47_9b]
MRDDGVTGFESPQTAQDEYALGLWRKYGLGDHPSFKDMEAKATELLDNPLTFFEGLSMVLGRFVGAKEKEIAKLIFVPADKRFVFAILQFGVEKLEREEV